MEYLVQGLMVELVGWVGSGKALEQVVLKVRWELEFGLVFLVVEVIRFLVQETLVLSALFEVTTAAFAAFFAGLIDLVEFVVVAAYCHLERAYLAIVPPAWLGLIVTKSERSSLALMPKIEPI